MTYKAIFTDEFLSHFHLDDNGKTLVLTDMTGLTRAVRLEEEKHGEWQITDAYPHNVYCSECHERFAQTHWAVWEDGSLPRNFCPNCGKPMRKRGEIK